MTRDELLAHLRADPFTPVRVHLDDGRTLDVARRDQAMIGRQEVYIAVPSASRPHLAKHVERVPNDRVTRVEVLDG